MQTDGTLLVPDVPTVPYITGDGVGAEVTPAMQAVVDAAIRKAYSGKRRIEWKEVLAADDARFDKAGEYSQPFVFTFSSHGDWCSFGKYGS